MYTDNHIRAIRALHDANRAIAQATEHQLESKPDAEAEMAVARNAQYRAVRAIHAAVNNRRSTD